MGKNIQISPQFTIKQLENKIHKHSSFTKNALQFIKNLKLHYPNLLAKQYLIAMHNFITNFKTQTKGTKEIGTLVYKYTKICRKCQDWKYNQNLIQCSQCEDSYHKKCITQKINSNNNWFCKICIDHLKISYQKQKKLDADYGIQNVLKKCGKCSENIKNQKKSKSCIKCTKSFHQQCSIQKKNKLVCQDCHKNIQQQIKRRKLQKQTDLTNYIKKIQHSKINFYNLTEINKQEQNSTVCQNSITVSFAASISLKSPPILTQKQIQQYKKNLMYAILSKGMIYTQENIYHDHDKKILQNIQQIDLSIERMNQKDLKSFLEYKKQPIGPYQIYPVKGLGYDVRTKKTIQKGTIICEYVGEVISRRKSIQFVNQSDSLMQVLTGNNADNSLIIMPKTYTNIARFINGINNYKQQSKDKANVQSVRFNVVGQPKVILYAKKEIRQDQTLQYDYNGSGEAFFPTENFL